MKIRCLFNRGKDLPLKLLPIVGFPQTEFDLIIGEEYTVYAISLWKNIQKYLVMPVESSSPTWYPADLFEVADHTIPSCWFYDYHGYYEEGKPSGLVGLWGYHELIFEKNHFRELVELEGLALKVFNMRKKEIDTEK
jgi:hypothetical protein